MYEVIIDCYTDEPCWLGVPPYLWTHQRYLSQALNYKNIKHYYLTIDDLRFFKNWNKRSWTEVKKTYNLTKNAYNVENLISWARRIHIITWCFVDYDYFSCCPPMESELYDFIKDINCYIVLYYILWINNKLPQSFFKWKLYKKVSHLVLWNPYQYILNQKSDWFSSPDYNSLSKISNKKCTILDQVERKYMIEIETGSWCSHAKCSFCIEALRKNSIKFRPVNDILNEIKTLYKQWARHIRLWKQPNIYNYMYWDPIYMEKLLSWIRKICPDIITLHIDNVDAESVITNNGIEITKLITKYCTSWNIANFWAESFDPNVRIKNNLNWDIDTITKAIEIINKYWKFIWEDWLYNFLPWINLLYWLVWQNDNTLEYNIKYLRNIYDKGFLTRRLFLRQVTNPHWSNFGGHNYSRETFNQRNELINNEFVLPMQKKVYPEKSIITWFEEIIQYKTETQLRKIGTCPERFILKSLVPENGTYNLKIVKHLWPRKMLWECV